MGKWWFSSPFSGTFFQEDTLNDVYGTDKGVFVPFLGNLFSENILKKRTSIKTVFVPFLGTLFSKRACTAPARLLSQAHLRRGWGDRFIRHSPSEMKCRFSQAGRASAGICNEKIEMRNGGAAHKNMEPPRRFETSDFLVSQT